MGYYSDNKGKGDVGEKTAINMFRRLGYKVTPSTPEENIYQDIDGYLTHIPQFGDDVLNLDGMPISIKNEESGYRYNEVYFEVASKVKPAHMDKFPEATVDGWIPSILEYTRAKLFAIIQPLRVGRAVKPSLLVLRVEDVRNMYTLDTYGNRAKVLPLSASRRIQLNTESTYPFQDALSYYMKRSQAEEIALINIT